MKQIFRYAIHETSTRLTLTQAGFYTVVVSRRGNLSSVSRYRISHVQVALQFCAEQSFTLSKDLVRTRVDVATVDEAGKCLRGLLLYVFLKTSSAWRTVGFRAGLEPRKLVKLIFAGYPHEEAVLDLVVEHQNVGLV